MKELQCAPPMSTPKHGEENSAPRTQKIVIKTKRYLMQNQNEPFLTKTPKHEKTLKFKRRGSVDKDVAETLVT